MASASASAASSVDHLYGSCSCGRNQYVIAIPLAHTRDAAVYFDNGSDGRLTHGAPITAFLRVPLAWYSSSTHAYTPLETPSSIARVFAPLDAAPSARRTFCGYCGTPLTYWADQPDGEGAFMSVPVGSLRARDQEKLEALGLLPEDEIDDEYDGDGDDVEEVRGEVEEADATVARGPGGPLLRSSELLRPPPFSVFHRTGNASGISWFEDMIQGSRLGRTQRARRGMGRTPDDRARVAWEVSEWNDAGSGGFGSMGFSSSHHAAMSGGGGYGFSSTMTTVMSSTSTSSTHIMSSTSGEGSREFGNSGVKRKTPEIEELE
ncbi:hypothetical protein KEM56_003547 [Ascosphaera pollenicola]|nr:hypothetical protein KEM56_003547 [Ascosphaera pollenicola]